VSRLPTILQLSVLTIDRGWDSRMRMNMGAPIGKQKAATGKAPASLVDCSFLGVRLGIRRFLLFLPHLIGEAVGHEHHSGRDKPDRDA